MGTIGLYGSLRRSDVADDSATEGTKLDLYVIGLRKNQYVPLSVHPTQRQIEIYRKVTKTSVQQPW